MSYRLVGVKRKRVAPSKNALSLIRPYPRPRTQNLSYRQNVMPPTARGTIEAKWVDFADTIPINTANQVFILMNGIAQGDTENQRTGNKVNLRAVYLKYWLDFNDQSSSLGASYRVILVYDRQCNQALPIPSGPYLTGTDITSMNNLDYKGRFYTLYDKTHDMNPNAFTSITDEKYINLATTMQFVGGTGVIGSISQGAIYLLVLGTDHTSSNPTNFKYQCRTKFTDP